MDGDGDMDIVISDLYAHRRLEWYENPLPEGSPSTDQWKRHVIGDIPAHDIEISDIDLDGHLEIITRQQALEGNIITIWKGDTADRR